MTRKKQLLERESPSDRTSIHTVSEDAPKILRKICSNVFLAKPLLTYQLMFSRLNVHCEEGEDNMKANIFLKLKFLLTGKEKNEPKKQWVALVINN